jgi:hypothetical protein
MHTLDDLNRLHAHHDRAASFVVGSLLHHELRAFAGDHDTLTALGQNRGLSKAVMNLATKAAVAVANTTDVSWAAPLAASGAEAAAFLESAERYAVLPRLGAVRVNGQALGGVQVGGAAAGWVGENTPKPIRSMSFASLSLTPRTLTVNVVLSEELVRLSVPGSLGLVERSLSASLTTALDTALLDPTSAAIAGVKPASLTNGLTGIVAAGDLAANVAQAIAGISGGAAARPVVVVSAATAARLTGLRDLTEAGIRVLVSPAAANRVIAIDADGILYTDDGVELRQGQPDLIMDDAPGAIVQGAAGAAPVHTSLWQSNRIALKALRHIAWLKRADAVAFVTLA